MNKRLNRSDYMFSLVFVFLLVCVAAAFFFGMEVGLSRADAKLAAYVAKQEEAAKKPGAYDQQHLVSFYHTIYAPYRDFSNVWFDKLKELQTQTTDASDVMKQLAKTADDKFAAASTGVTPQTSPLLGEAHANMLKALKLFADTAKTYQSRANALHPSALLGELDKDAYLREAKTFALLGQQQYYMAIVKWNEAAEPPAKGADLLGQTPVTVKDWSQMGLNVKNAAVASILLNDKRYLPLYPQDMTVRIDEMIANGQAQRMNLQDIPAITALLADTNAARKGDFIARKELWYSGETKPQLPFFYEN